jgi:cytochrome c-type biogenesis protein CcmH/NrfG
MAEYAAASYPDCERFAAAAVRLDPANPKSNYLLALALLQMGRPPDQAVPLLEKAVPSFPRAAEILALIRRRQEPAPTLK